MFCHASETFQMGLDALSPLGEGRWLLCGWVMHPRGEEARLQFLGTDGRRLPLLFEGRHPRPDVTPARPGTAEVCGFHLVFAAGEEGRGGLHLLAEVEGQEIRARLGDPAVREDLDQVIATRGWPENLSLLADAQRAGDTLAPLFRTGGRAFGVFNDWVERLPRLGAAPVEFGPAAALGLGVTPAGDLGLVVRPKPGDVLRPDAVRLEALQRLSPAPACDRTHPVVPLRIEEWRTETVGGALLAWGRLEQAGRLVGGEVEVILEGWVGQEGFWARCTPPVQDVTGLFDALAAAALGPDPTPETRVALRRALARLLARREEAARAALMERLDQGGASAEEAPLLVLLGVEEELGLRLIEAAAPALAGAAPPVLLFGPAAPLGGFALEEAGVAALSGALAEAALEEARARPVRALTLSDLAEAIIADRLEEALRTAGPGPSARALALLHRFAGPGPDPAATLARLAGREAPLQTPSCPEAATALAAHLDALWAAVGPAFPRSEAHHG